MRIALDEIDPHIAAQYTVMTPEKAGRVPTTRHTRPRLSRRRRMALAASLVAPPMLGFQLANLAANSFRSVDSWLPWVIWFGIWIAGTGIGCRATLHGKLASRRATVLMTLNAVVAPVIGFAAAVMAFQSMSSYTIPMGFWMTWLTFSLPAALLGSRIALNVAPQSAKITELQSEGLQDVFASLSLTRAERVYCDILLFLARAHPNPDTEQTMRDTLRQLNDLMQSSRQLEEQRLSLLPLLGANVVPELRTEYDQLKMRLEAVTDPMTRASLEQSRRMVLSRIENAHNLQTGLERLNTQQEAITQTLSSALSALGRMHITPDLRVGTNTEFAMNDITDSVTQMNRQTIAVESAVEEVLTLRSSS